MSRPVADVPAEKLALYEDLVSRYPDVKRKGAKRPYTSMNGNMFSFMTPEGVLALRLPAKAREAFLAEHDTRLCEQYGTVMKEYVEVPDEVLTNSAAVQEIFDVSYAYVGTLKPKPTKRKPASGGKKKS